MGDGARTIARLWWSPDVAVVVWDPDGCCVAVNARFVEAVGPLAAGYPGHRAADLFDCDLAGQLTAIIEQVAGSGCGVGGVVLEFGTQRWETVWLPVRGSPDPARTGTAGVEQVVCLGLEPTARSGHLAPDSGRTGWLRQALAVGPSDASHTALLEVFAQLSTAVSARSAMVAVFDDEGRLVFRPELHSSVPHQPEWPTTVEVDDPVTFSGVAVTGGPVWLGDPHALRDRFRAAYRRLAGTPEQAWAAVPIRLGATVLGVLRLAWDTPQQFPAEQRRFVQAVADHAGQVLHRAQLLDRERDLRQAAERAATRTAELLKLARALAGARTPQQVGQAVADTGFGGGVVAGGVGVIDETAGVLRVLSTYRGSSWGQVPLDSPLPFVRAARTGRFHMSTRAEVLAISPAAAAWMDDVGARLAVSVPLYDDEHTVGSLSVHLAHDHADESTVQHIQAVAALVGQALGRAVAQEQAHAAVVELQRALLPRQLPRVAGVTVRAGYQPSLRASEIGGDFYDAVTRSDGSIVLLLGDVQGHDLTASAIMAQLRAVLHSLAADGQPPAELLSRADEFLAATELDRLATMIAIDVSPATGLAIISVAGHLPPLLLTPDRPTVVDVKPDPPLGLRETLRSEHVLALPPTSRLVLLTDGLIERRDAAITDSLNDLLDRLSATPYTGAQGAGVDPTPALDRLIDTLMRQAPQQTGDDAAVLVAEIVLPGDGAQPPTRIERTIPPITRAAYSVRRWAQAGLRRLGIDEETFADTLMVLAELTANGARASGGPITISVEHLGQVIRVGVRDDTHRLPHLRAAGTTDQDGRGLAIVEALAQRWGVDEHHSDGGKTVWAELALRRPAR